ncbi:hypothetical protein P7C70_g609, partial [Phenoliferia sp. Uapishka_3]
MFTWIRDTIGGVVAGPEWDLKSIGDLTDKVAVVTGVSCGGIGYEVAKALVRNNAHVYLACRDESRAVAAMSSIERELATAQASTSQFTRVGKMSFLHFDLLDIQACTAAASTLIFELTRLDLVVANAGVAFWPWRLIEGVELQFYNHLGHFAFVNPLIPLLELTAKSKPHGSTRIIVLTSNSHHQSPRPDFASIASVSQPYRTTLSRYAQSKLCNLLFVNSLSRKIPPAVKVLGVHPGPVASQIYSGSSASWPFTRMFAKYIIPYFLLTPEEGAASVLFGLFAEEDLVGPSGGYIVPRATLAKPSATALDENLADELWSLSEHAVRVAT